MDNDLKITFTICALIFLSLCLGLLSANGCYESSLRRDIEIQNLNLKIHQRWSEASENVAKALFHNEE